MSKLLAALVALSIAYSVQGKAAMFYITTSRLIVKCTMGYPVTPKSTFLGLRHRNRNSFNVALFRISNSTTMCTNVSNKECQLSRDDRLEIYKI